jgi:hypothetical protein
VLAVNVPVLPVKLKYRGIVVAVVITCVVPVYPLQSNFVAPVIPNRGAAKMHMSELILTLFMSLFLTALF